MAQQGQDLGAVMKVWESSEGDWLVSCLVGLQVSVNLCFCGVIFGYASLQLLFEEDGVFRSMCGAGEAGCEKQVQSLLLVYTLGSSFQVFSSFPVGILVDALGPVFCTLLGGAMCVTGLLLFGHSAPDSIVTFSIGSILLSLGGTITFVSSFLLGFIVKKRHVSYVMTLLNCAFDGSTAIFLIFYLITHFLGVSRQAIFTAYAMLGVCIYAPLAILWSHSGEPALLQRKQEARTAAKFRGPQTDQSSVQLAEAHPEQPACLDDALSVEGCDDSDNKIPPPSAVATKDHERHSDFHKLHWWQQLNSTRFVCLALFGSVHLYRANAYMGVIKNVLFKLGDDKYGYLYTTIYSAMLPLGAVFIPLIDWLIYNHEFHRQMQICTFLGFVYGSLALVPNLPLQVVTFAFFCLFRALFYSVVGTYSVQIFGPINAGRSYGCVWMLGSVLNLLVWPALIITDRFAGGSYLPFNVFLLSLCIPLAFSTELVLKPSLAEVHGAQRPTRDS